MQVQKFLLLLSMYLSFVMGGKIKDQEKALAEKVKFMSQEASRRVIIKLKTSTFKSYITAVPKNYSTIVMFTAMNPSRQCGICQQAKEEFEVRILSLVM